MGSVGDRGATDPAMCCGFRYELKCEQILNHQDFTFCDEVNNILKKQNVDEDTTDVLGSVTSRLSSSDITYRPCPPSQIIFILFQCI